ncbi:50S ribosomal protein L15 [Candidatus Saccharibacteria bacterium]|nr:50S ribosomal protein L15 [Candidatus Saccharibacteria bacterium]
MKFNELKVNKLKKPTRKGRGIAAGEGKTAGRGTKGQGARKSGGVRPGFEGGQMPLYMKLPKLRGFTSHRQKVYNVYTGQLDSIKKSVIDTDVLTEEGLIENPYVKVKVVLKGDLNKKLTVKLQGASSGAIKAIEKAGGKFEKTQQLGRPAKKTKEQQ